MSVSTAQLALLVAAALGSGIVDAIAGGGGLISVPALLAVGLPPHLALGTNKGQSVFGSGASLLHYARAGMIHGPRARVGFPLGLAGSFCGAALVLLVPPAALRPLVLVLLIAVAIALALRRSKPATHVARVPRHELLVAGAIAFAIAAYDGFFGPGTGTFLIFAFVYFFDATMARASADAKVVNFASNLAAVALFAWGGQVVWRIALPMAVAQAAGGFIGAQLAIQGGDKWVRRIVLLVVAALVVKLASDLVRA